MLWINKPFLWLILFYKKVLSPALPAACRFYPTCSQYAYQSFQQYPFPIALYFSVKRILRCQPWGGHGYDPVPTKNQKST